MNMQPFTMFDKLNLDKNCPFNCFDLFHKAVEIENCRITIVRGEPMFVNFMGKPCPQSLIHTNLYTIIYLISRTIIPITLPTKLRPREPEKKLATHKH